MDKDKILKDNQDNWDRVAHLFVEASALPVWGPLGVGDDLGLLPEISGKTFLEIACGSGRSIKYLTDNGAKKVYGLDLSKTQIDEARRYNSKAVKDGIVDIFQGPMEEKLNIEPVDVVFSVYGLGWTVDPEKTFANIYSYLKPGGSFIWSWDHTICTDIQYVDGEYTVVYSYHDESPVRMENWRGAGGVANITYRKTSAWINMMIKAGFEIKGYFEPEPKDLSCSNPDPTSHYHIEKAKRLPVTVIYLCSKPKQ